MKVGWEDRRLVKWIEIDPIKSLNISDGVIAKETMKLIVLIMNNKMTE